MTTAKGTFEVTGWNEDSYEDRDDGRKLSRAEVTQSFTGDVTGDGAVQWLMSYQPDGTAHFVGMQRVTGSIGVRNGSFVLEVSGDFDGKVAAGTWSVVAGSGTQDLESLSGTGSFEAPMGPRATFELDYELS